MNFYPHHIGDFNNATRHLTRVERSVYRDAIDLYYDTEGPLTKDIDYLCRRLLCSTEDEKEALKIILDEFFTLSDEGYRHDRCDSEIQKYRGNISAKAKAGKASAEARRKSKKPRTNKTEAQSEHNLTGVARNSTCVHNQEPLTTNHKPITNNQDKDKNTLVDTGVSTDSLDDSNTDKPPSCPHAEIIAAYHEILPELDSVVVSLWKPNTKRYKWLQARWRESDKHQSIKFWRAYFSALRKHPFYLGENNRGWKANLEWVVKQENFIKLIEKFRSEDKR